MPAWKAEAVLTDRKDRYLLTALLPVINVKATGVKIKDLIKAKGLTVKDIQKVFGVASPYPVYKWQNVQSLPAIENLVVLAKIIGVAVDDLLVVTEP